MEQGQIRPIIGLSKYDRPVFYICKGYVKTEVTKGRSGRMNVTEKLGSTT